MRTAWGRARRITIDLDVTDDPTHGAQQLTFFHGHYDTLCYLPLLAFLTFDDEAEQYLCAALLRPGNAATAVGAVGLLQRLCVLLREAFPATQLRVRLDGGFAAPALLDQLDVARVEYVVAMAENTVLTRHAEPLMADVRTQVAATGATASFSIACATTCALCPVWIQILVPKLTSARNSAPPPPASRHSALLCKIICSHAGSWSPTPPATGR